MVGLKNRDASLLAALAEGKSIAEVAVKTGVSERTIHRRLADPEFADELSKVRREILDRAVSRLSAAAEKAVETLECLLDSPHDPTRLGAARSVLEIGAKLREDQALVNRVKELEEKLANAGVASGQSKEEMKATLNALAERLKSQSSDN